MSIAALSPGGPHVVRKIAFATPVREAGAAPHWVTLHAEGSEEGTCHILIGGNGAIQAGPKSLVGHHIAALASHPSVSKAQHHPVGHEPPGARDHPHYAEAPPNAERRTPSADVEPAQRPGKPYARLHGAEQGTRAEQIGKALSEAQGAAKGAKATSGHDKVADTAVAHQQAQAELAAHRAKADRNPNPWAPHLSPPVGDAKDRELAEKATRAQLAHQAVVAQQQGQAQAEQTEGQRAHEKDMVRLKAETAQPKGDAKPLAKPAPKLKGRMSYEHAQQHVDDLRALGADSKMVPGKSGVDYDVHATWEHAGQDHQDKATTHEDAASLKERIAQTRSGSRPAVQPWSFTTPQRRQAQMAPQPEQPAGAPAPKAEQTRFGQDAPAGPLQHKPATLGDPIQPARARPVGQLGLFGEHKPLAEPKKRGSATQQQMQAGQKSLFGSSFSNPHERTPAPDAAETERRKGLEEAERAARSAAIAATTASRKNPARVEASGRAHDAAMAALAEHDRGGALQAQASAPAHDATLTRDRQTGRAWLDFGGTKPPQEHIDALKREGWRYSGYRQQWHNPRKYVQAPAGITAHDAGHNDYSSERAERNEARAGTVRAEAQQQIHKAHDIGSRIPMGQPILVGHHSEARHRADLGRIDRAMGKGVEGLRQAERLEQRAQSTGSAKARGEDAGVVQRRIARLEADRRSITQGVNRWPDGPERESRVGAIDQELATHRQRLDELGGAKELDYKPGDIVRSKGGLHRVESIGPRNVKLTDLGPSGFVLSHDKSHVTDVVKRAHEVTPEQHEQITAGIRFESERKRAYKPPARVRESSGLAPRFMTPIAAATL